MPYVIPEIKTLPHDGRSWVLEWIGRMHRHPGDATNPQVEILMAPLRSPDSSPIAVSARIAAERKIFKVPFAALPMLAVGTVWVNGKLSMNTWNPKEMHSHRFLKTRVENLDVSRERCRPVKLGTRIQHSVDALEDLVPEALLEFGKFRDRVNDSTLLAVEANGDPFALLFPSYELFRFYGAGSSKWVKACATREWPVQWACSSLTIEHRVARVALYKHVPDEDAWYVARVHGSEEARGAVTELRTSIVQCARNDAPIFPSTRFWFRGTTNMELVTLPFPGLRPDRPRHLVVRILSCSGAFPFRELWVDRENDGRKREDADRRRPKDDTAQPRTGPGLADAAEIDPEAVADSTLEYFRCHLPYIDKFLAIKNERIRKNEKAEDEDLPTFRRSAKPAEPETVSTGSRTTSSDAARPGSISMKRDATGSTTDLSKVDSFRFVHEVAAGLSAVGFTCDLIGIDALVGGPPGLSRFGVNDPLASGWAFIDRDRTQNRGALIFRISLGESCAYMVEIERRPGKSNTYLLPVFCKKNCDQFSDVELRHILKVVCIHRGVWRKAMDSLDLADRRLFYHRWSDSSGSETTSDLVRRYLTKVF